jgi:cytochrome c-type biogenesis protein CcmH
MKRFLLGTLLAVALALGAAPAPANEAVPTFSDPVVAKREVELASQLRCLVCQNQSIAESNAGLAADLRKQLREQIAAGKSDAEIVEYMTSRYGDFVLYRPPFKATTALLWLGPVLLLALGGWVAVRLMRARGRSAAIALSPQDRARAEQLLAATGKGTKKP